MVVKLYINKDIGVGNLRKFEYFLGILDIHLTREIRFN